MSIATRNGARPDVAATLSRLKDFQRSTVDHAFRRLYLDADSTHRFLVADEVGLGKTLVARGVIARALDHLWDRVERIDIIYICSNSDIARQNVNRLNVLAEKDVAMASRLTMLPTELKGLRKNKVNFVSFTPATSFELKSSTGQSRERVLLYHMLRDVWHLRGAAPRNVFQGYSGAESFRAQLKSFEDEIDSELLEAFKLALDHEAAEAQSRTEPTLRARLDELCGIFDRLDARVSKENQKARNAFIGDLRRLLAETCIRALQPDLIILDEFQRFKQLLAGDDEAALLARELFNYSDGHSRARVLLLSATPYKMYTAVDEAGDEDHYRDFVDTLRFLQHDVQETAKTGELLRAMRRALMRGAAGFGEIESLKAQIEATLRRVVARTERLATTADRSGMLREVRPSAPVRLTPGDAMAYCALEDIASAFTHPNTVEFWKTAPFLLNFMDEYDIKAKFVRAIEASEEKVCAAVRRASKASTPLLLSHNEVEDQRPADPPHPRMRWLIGDVVDRGTWQLLWLPPSLPYYGLGGPFARQEVAGFTKRLVFSAWRVAPKAIATLVSYEAERRMFEQARKPGELRSDQIARTRGLLKLSKSDGRLGGMPVLALVYPSIALARLGDPLALGVSPGVPAEQVRQRIEERISTALASVSSGIGTDGLPDESWYWAAPILLDLADSPEPARSWLARRSLAKIWEGEVGTPDEEDAGWAEHVDVARKLAATGPASLGPPPPDLARVLSELALSGPAVCALRALSRGAPSDDRFTHPAIRDAAGVLGHGFRDLFNLPDVMSMVRTVYPGEPYWRRVLDYARDGCLQAVLDEFVHMLREAEGIVEMPAGEAAPKLAARMRDALSIRTSRLGFDDVRIAGNGRVKIESRTMRARFAMRFGEEQTDDGSERTRSDVVRTAFNSPFWPFVLASTSVGQEGLDFHLYCHAVVHWNLPSNPVDMEQREGRVHRFKGHAVRKNIAARYGAGLGASGDEDPWSTLFEMARQDRGEGASDLVPYWLFPLEGGAAIERHVPTLPLSRDVSQYAALRQWLAVYRMVFGQPRQDELVEYLIAQAEDSSELMKLDLRIDLTPPSNGGRM